MSEILVPETYGAPAPDQHIMLLDEMTPHLRKLQMGMKNYQRIGRKGDLVAFLTQIKPAGSHGDVPALVLANARSPREHHTAIPLHDLYTVVSMDRTTKFNRDTCTDFAAALYGTNNPSKGEVDRVQDAFYEFGEQLKNAPCPKWITSKQWLEAVAKDGFTMHVNGRKVKG